LHEGSKENTSPSTRKKFSHGSPKAARKKTSSEVLRLSRASSTLCETPDAVRNYRHTHLTSPSLETYQNKNHKKNSTSSSDSVFDSRRSSNNSENDMHKQYSSWPEDVSQVDTTGSMFYVRLGNVSEKGVFVSIHHFLLFYFFVTMYLKGVLVSTYLYSLLCPRIIL
jgi:hypothetical protein